MDVRTMDLASSLAVLPNNSIYTVGDIIGKQGREWPRRVLTILADARYRHTILHELLLRTTTCTVRGEERAVRLSALPEAARGRCVRGAETARQRGRVQGEG